MKNINKYKILYIISRSLKTVVNFSVQNIRNTKLKGDKPEIHIKKTSHFNSNCYADNIICIANMY